MRVTITIDTDNAAFEDSLGYEVARVLRKLADTFNAHSALLDVDGEHLHELDGHKLRDINGNTVGSVKVS